MTTKERTASTEAKIVYFKKPGESNTDEVLRIAREWADRVGIKTVVVASGRGFVACKAVDVFKGMKVVVVTAHTGWYHQPNVQHFTEESRRIVEGKGGIIVTAPHVFGGISYAMQDKFETAMLGVDMGNTLRILGQGMKVVCEIAMAAADAGALRTDEEVISIGGTNTGSDTAVVLKPVNVHDFFNLRIKEILCKPRL
jgi:hypothetical protein